MSLRLIVFSLAVIAILVCIVLQFVQAFKTKVTWFTVVTTGLLIIGLALMIMTERIHVSGVDGFMGNYVVSPVIEEESVLDTETAE